MARRDKAHAKRARLPLRLVRLDGGVRLSFVEPKDARLATEQARSPRVLRRVEIKQNLRVEDAPDAACGVWPLQRTNELFYATHGLATSEQRAASGGPKARQGPCLPGEGTPDRKPFGYNYTHPSSPLDKPFLWYSTEDIGANPEGQRSASQVAQWSDLPSSGHAIYVFPFFSDVLLPEQRGRPAELVNFRQHSLNASLQPAHFCVRLAWSVDEVRQLCDPNDEDGRTTGVVGRAISDFWEETKRARFFDDKTRALTFTLPARDNNHGLRTRLVLVFQIESSLSVTSSYDLESRVDALDTAGLLATLWSATALTVFFVLLELYEIWNQGWGKYLSNFWNLIDVLNYCLFALVFWSVQEMVIASAHFQCGLLCDTVGWIDPWFLMRSTTEAKLWLSVCTTLQLLKVIKFVNVFVPKMALATEVMSHGLPDLGFFFLVFVWTMFAFAQFCQLQLGAYMSGFSSNIECMYTFFRALFGDFDMEQIISSSYNNTNLGFFVRASWLKPSTIEPSPSSGRPLSTRCLDDRFCTSSSRSSSCSPSSSPSSTSTRATCET